MAKQSIYANRMTTQVIIQGFKAPEIGFITSILGMMELRSRAPYIPAVIPVGAGIDSFCPQILCSFHTILERRDGT